MSTHKPRSGLLLLTAATALLTSAALMGSAVLDEAWSEDAPAPKQAPSKKITTADPDAAAIGRALLSSDAAVRERALQRLLARVERGRGQDAHGERAALEAFFNTLAHAARDWANRRERLLEVWVDQAVHGNARERDEAARLLAALGPAAIARLTDELRHALGQRGALSKRDEPGATPPVAPDAKDDAAPATKTGSETSPSKTNPLATMPPADARPPAPVRAAGTPRLYNVKDLLGRGMDAVEMRSLLQKAPDAVSVKNVSRGVYVVTAADDGHTALQVRLELLRTSLDDLEDRRQDAKRQKKSLPALPLNQAAPPHQAVPPNQAVPATGTQTPNRMGATPNGLSQDGGTTPKPAPRAPTSDLVAKRATAPDKPVTASKSDANPTATKTKDNRTWRVVPTIYRVPRTVLTNARGGYAVAARSNGLPHGLDPAITEVRTGSELDAVAWTRVLERGPQGVQGVAAEGAPQVCAGGCCRLFSGTSRPYRKGFRRDADGTFHYEMGSLRLGIDLDITLATRAQALDVRVVASHTEVALPMAVDKVRPAPGQPALDLERPEWSRTRTRTAFVLPAQGGSALLSLGGLGGDDDQHVIVILRVLPVASAAASK